MKLLLLEKLVEIFMVACISPDGCGLTRMRYLRNSLMNRMDEFVYRSTVMHATKIVAIEERGERTLEESASSRRVYRFNQINRE